MKNRFKRILFLLLLITIHQSLITREALAVCPICTIAVGAGLGLSRWLGIDDAVSSIWIGGLILSSSFWIIDYLKKKKPEFPISNFQFPIIFLMYLLVLLPLWYQGIIGHPLNTIIGIDKVIFGTALGSIMFLVGMWADKKVRKIKGKQLFQYQKVVFPVISLVITSLLIYYYGGYLY
ncbi:hypothetical protein A2714_02395 [Candidatus Woesebacteria bacterium RIFCSPHIGHO2_01_FULL_38_9]|uniref:Uncharacterized protein n=2 Tax=Candidatus Woeseibacteriota TaxID=1752722 RepID=A0A1F7XYV6_9BACT|nr:MAG: hypothetical protein A2714_02395 [Candidatus Woesebacteria bacterium RIFCSPHIGHO2_01_FULL_38_9]OGM59051.1 MAG: hypothetical protein A3A75_05270 [Candidatus Woesebacteria bacterium RIFCSPLOWO2_01_FULL_39_10]